MGESKSDLLTSFIILSSFISKTVQIYLEHPVVSKFQDQIPINIHIWTYRVVYDDQAFTRETQRNGYSGISILKFVNVYI